MLKKLILLCALSVPLAACADDVAPFSGEISTQALLSDYDKFNEQYNAFTPTEQDIALMQKLEGKELIVLFGTWCHDSHREVPKLIKLIDESKVELASIDYVAVGYNKRDDAGIAEAYDLQYTPTFIVKDDGKELVRVIEKPTGTLAEDLTQGL
ncbi:thioredoxin family protein [Pseudoalteromonas sp. 10-33]|jgi:thiol-disulfide isomerase/thioredoxin|uniref:thioredoxin family protein n=1 Tax=Pseudoalteromonas sp. 10-33 TaxID=1761890 RepID=UPI0007320131|nr:thioredoxin family protein [Pseudoalteromonas sp. 10-33]KTF17809.1 thioredoxin [Pseudoalteromonas sp. 10-33]